MLMVSVAGAQLEDPFEKRTLTPVDGTKFAPGLCPGSAPQPFMAPSFRVGEATPTERIQEDVKLQNALWAAGAIYELPDLENAANGNEIITQTIAFTDSLPNGYEFYAFFSEPRFGLKYMILEPRSSTAPWILSIAGTQGLVDVVIDADMGYSQLVKTQKLLSLLTSCQYLDESGQPLAAKSWIVTGHSLGGGVAQAFAYRVQQERRLKRLSAIDLRTVTFNAFGARELIQKSGVVEESIVASMRARNFFIKGDPISKIGSHLGATYQLLPPRSRSEDLEPSRPDELLRRHSMKILKESTVRELLLTQLSTARLVKPSTMDSLTRIGRFGSMFRFVPDAIYERSEKRLIDKLYQGAVVSKALEPTNEHHRRAKSYLSRLIFARLLAAEKARSPNILKLREAQALLK